MTSAKTRMRDGFLLDMYDNHKLDKDATIEILKGAGFDINKFEVNLLSAYEEAVKKAILKESIKERMKPFPRTDCLIPGCPGEKIAYTRSGSNQWFCSETGNYCWMLWRIARLKALSDLKNKIITEEQIDVTVEAFIKEYEAYGKSKDREATP